MESFHSYLLLNLLLTVNPEPGHAFQGTRLICAHAGDGLPALLPGLLCTSSRNVLREREENRYEQKTGQPWPFACILATHLKAAPGPGALRVSLC